MDRRYSSYNYGSDSNFSDILDRTRQNISRISSRYSAEALDQSSSFSQKPKANSYKNYLSDEPFDPASNQRAMVGYSRTEPEPSENRPPACTSNEKPSGLDDILNRLSRLEQENSGRLRMEERMLKLETSVDSIRSVVDSLVADNREAKREVSKIANQLSGQNTSLEILQHDVDSRRRLIV